MGACSYLRDAVNTQTSREAVPNRMIDHFIDQTHAVCLLNSGSSLEEAFVIFLFRHPGSCFSALVNAYGGLPTVTKSPPLATRRKLTLQLKSLLYRRWAVLSFDHAWTSSLLRRGGVARLYCTGPRLSSAAVSVPRGVTSVTTKSD